MNNPALLTQAAQWLDDRLGLKNLYAIAAKKEVPLHRHSVWYYLGGIALILLMVQLVTGILLMFYYVPELKSAHSSVLFINSQVEFGWFIRSLHSWGANLFILALFIHLFSTYFLKAYRPPRELTWLTGLGLMILGLAFGFTGYLLPWDEVSFFATKIGLDISSKLPLIGPYMVSLLQGGTDVSQSTLSRFFVIHVIILPLALLGLLSVHLFLVQLKGMSQPDEFNALPPEKKHFEKFFPTFVLKDAMVWLLILNLLATCVALAPWGLGSEADPFAPAPIGIKPEWYFLAMFQFLKQLPANIGPLEGEMVGLGLFSLVGVFFALAPFLDNGHRPGLAKITTWLGILISIMFVVFTVWGLVS